MKIDVAESSLIPAKRRSPPAVADMETEGISCICQNTADVGMSICCDDCGRWCHVACFSIPENQIPELWSCWKCSAKSEKKGKRKASAIGEMNQNAARRRRPTTTPLPIPTPTPTISHPGISPEESPIDIHSPWEHSYVAITSDVVHDPLTRATLRSHRGLTAITPTSAQIALVPLSNGTAGIRPPEYSLHTKEPLRRSAFIAPYPALITPSSQYLADPLNGYAALGIPKPHVHFVGFDDPEKAVALDARRVGGEARWIRSGCRPNAALRPMMCGNKNALSFGIFATRDLKVNEEIVLGWEWDDSHAIHTLPALLQSNKRALRESAIDKDVAREQMRGVLHALGGTFAKCACGDKAANCAINKMREFVDSGSSTGPVDLGPLVGIERGFRTRERIPLSGGIGGVEIVPRLDDSQASPTEDRPHSAQEESCMPLKMRKRSFYGSLTGSTNASSPTESSRRSASTSTDAESEVESRKRTPNRSLGPHITPSAQLPPKLWPTPDSLFAGPSPSPSTYFAGLTLQSPAIGKGEYETLAAVPALQKKDKIESVPPQSHLPSPELSPVPLPSSEMQTHENSPPPIVRPRMPTPAASPSPQVTPTLPVGPPRSPSPPKVKLSFKEFALRKQKLAAEQAVAKSTEVAQPVNTIDVVMSEPTDPIEIAHQSEVKQTPYIPPPEPKTPPMPSSMTLTASQPEQEVAIDDREPAFIVNPTQAMMEKVLPEIRRDYSLDSQEDGEIGNGPRSDYASPHPRKFDNCRSPRNWGLQSALRRYNPNTPRPFDRRGSYSRDGGPGPDRGYFNRDRGRGGWRS